MKKLLPLIFLLAGCTTVYQGGAPVAQVDNTGPLQAGDSCQHYGPGTYTCSPTYDSTAMSVSGPCPSNCGLNRQWWTNGFSIRPLAGTNTLALQATYKASASGGGDWHGYLCAQLTDTTTFQQILWCGETWRSDGPPGPANQGWDSTVSGDSPQGIGSLPNGGFTIWHPAASGVVSVTGAQLQATITEINKWLPATVHSYGQTEHFQKYSTNPADYAFVAIQCGQEGTGPAGSGVTASCDNLKAGYA
jgi:hypothetical protein